MAVITLGALLTGAIGGFFAFIQALTDHPLMAYLVVLAGLSLTTGIQGLTGFGLVSFIITPVVTNVFGLHGFVITDFQILMIFVFFPLIMLAIKQAKAM